MPLYDQISYTIGNHKLRSCLIKFAQWPLNYKGAYVTNFVIPWSDWLTDSL